MEFNRKSNHRFHWRPRYHIRNRQDRPASRRLRPGPLRRDHCPRHRLLRASSSEDTDFLPLRVDYQEKFSSAGKTLGGFIKREGRPY